MYSLYVFTRLSLFVSHSDTYKFTLLGYSTSEQEDLRQHILRASKCNISFPQDIVDLMQRFTDNPDDISPEEYEIISNHQDAAVDMERDNGEFPLHTHLLSIHLHFYTSSIFLSKINTLILLKPDFLSCVSLLSYITVSAR